MSEGITVRSVLGPFLEHSRILSFQAGDRVSTWIGSADLMPRNLDRRIEVLAPVEHPLLQARIAAIPEALLADTRFAWELGPDGFWTRVKPAHGERAVSAQEVLMGQALKRADRLGIWYLHVWTWEPSPSGLFADWNPRVKCGTDGSAMSH
jgi:polyphosphate kinase